MEVKTTLTPGKKGTKQLVKTYGEKLVCVRYRYDKARQKCFKTVELIIDEKDWIPETTISLDQKVLVQVGLKEGEIRERVKAVGGQWVARQRAWQLTYQKVLELGLENRICGDI